MLDEVNKPGSDIEQYLSELEGVLGEKTNSINEMKKAIAHFQQLIENEKALNAKIKELGRKKTNMNYGQEMNRKSEY